MIDLQRFAAACAAAALCMLLGTPLASPAAGGAPPEVLAAMRSVRLRGCDSRAGLTLPLRSNAALNGAAALWSHGLQLKAAIARSGYRDDESAGLHLRGDARVLESALTRQLCAPLANPAMTDAGVFARDGEDWIIVAAPFSAPSPAAAAGADAEVLRLVNAARADARRCGARLMTAAAPLRPNAALNRAALAHAQDMVRQDYFEHTGYDGSNPAQRIAAAGYRYRLAGENLALGPQTAREAVRGWLSSPAHCQNLMDPRFADTGVAVAASRSGAPRIYWVQEFAATR
ncbi:MAG TPA: CAP domain-containing protein [Steroidobacteraceae bacterium]